MGRVARMRNKPSLSALASKREPGAAAPMPADPGISRERQAKMKFAPVIGSKPSAQLVRTATLENLEQLMRKKQAKLTSTPQEIQSVLVQWALAEANGRALYACDRNNEGQYYKLQDAAAELPALLARNEIPKLKLGSGATAEY